jgi:hypothetical protein
MEKLPIEIEDIIRTKLPNPATYDFGGFNYPISSQNDIITLVFEIVDANGKEEWKLKRLTGI